MRSHLPNFSLLCTFFSHTAHIQTFCKKDSKLETAYLGPWLVIPCAVWICQRFELTSFFDFGDDDCDPLSRLSLRRYRTICVWSSHFLQCTYIAKNFKNKNKKVSLPPLSLSLSLIQLQNNNLNAKLKKYKKNCTV